MLLFKRPEVEHLEPWTLLSSKALLAGLPPVTAGARGIERQGGSPEIQGKSPEIQGKVVVSPGETAIGGNGPADPPVLPVTDDFGDTFETAHHLLLLLRNPISQTGVINYAGDVDMFRFEAPGSNALLIRPEPTRSPLNILLTVFDGNGQQFVQKDNADGRTPVTFAAVAGERYYVRVAASPFTAPGTETGDFAFGVVPQFQGGDFISPGAPRSVPVQAEAPLVPAPGAATESFTAPALGLSAADTLRDEEITGDAHSLFAAGPAPRSGHHPSGVWHGLALDPASEGGEDGSDRVGAPEGTGSASGLLSGLALFDSRNPGVETDGAGQGRLAAELIPLEELSLARAAALLPADGDAAPEKTASVETTEGDAALGVPGAGAPAHAAPPRDRRRTLTDLLLPNPLPERVEQPKGSRGEGRSDSPWQGKGGDRLHDAVLLLFAAGLVRVGLDKSKSGAATTDEATQAIRAGQGVQGGFTIRWP
jgi:hypothetical protein